MGRRAARAGGPGQYAYKFVLRPSGPGSLGTGLRRGFLDGRLDRRRVHDGPGGLPSAPVTAAKVALPASRHGNLVVLREFSHACINGLKVKSSQAKNPTLVRLAPVQANAGAGARPASRPRVARVTGFLACKEHAGVHVVAVCEVWSSVRVPDDVPCRDGVLEVAHATRPTVQVVELREMTHRLSQPLKRVANLPGYKKPAKQPAADSPEPKRPGPVVPRLVHRHFVLDAFDNFHAYQDPLVVNQ